MPEVKSKGKCFMTFPIQVSVYPKESIYNSPQNNAPTTPPKNPTQV